MFRANRPKVDRDQWKVVSEKDSGRRQMKLAAQAILVDNSLL